MTTTLSRSVSVRAIVVRAILSGIAIALVLAVPFSVLADINGRIRPEWPWAAAATVTYIALAMVWLNGRGWPRSNGPTRRFNLRLWRPEPDAWTRHRGEIVGLILAIVAIYVFWDLSSPPRAITDFSPYPTTSYRISLFVMGALVSGVTEEIAFRGYMQSQLERIGPAFAVLVTSVVFALMHITHGLIPLLVLLPGYLMIGLCFSQLAYRTGSILPSMVLHVLGDASHAWYVLLGADLGRLVVH